jgi:hypothetical protein
MSRKLVPIRNSGCECLTGAREARCATKVQWHSWRHIAYTDAMRIGIRVSVFISIFLVTAQALAGNLTITLNNDTTSNLLVTVYDMNAQPPLRVLSSALINGNASITVSISSDPSDQGYLAWTATTVDRDMRACGHGGRSNLNDGDAVRIQSDSDCSG